jgi:hypothetical protein
MDREVIINTLILEGIDVPTAVAAVADDERPTARAKRTPWGFLLGMAVALVWWWFK